MDATRAKDAVGIKGALEPLVHGEQSGRKLLDAMALVAAVEQRGVSVGLVRRIECSGRIEVLRDPAQAAVPFHYLFAETQRLRGRFDRATPQRRRALEGRVGLLADRRPERGAVLHRIPAQLLMRSRHGRGGARQTYVQRAIEVTGRR